MSKLLNSIALPLLLAATSAPVLAADLPSRSPPAYVAPAVPVFTWTGLYVGVNAGGIFGRSNDGFYDPTYGTVTGSGDSGSAFAGGGQIGYNYQFTPGSGFVVGIETDLQGVATGSSSSQSYALGTIPFYNIAPSLDWYGTTRGRLGYAFDRLLVYGTGGLAYGGGSLPAIATSYPYSLPDTTRTGYTLGAGVEYAVTQNLSAKLEGLYVNLGRSSGTVTYLDTTTPAYYGSSQKDEAFGVVRVGLNYRF